MKMEFTKEDSLAMKGIAICLMLVHHLFYNSKSSHGMPVETLIFDMDTVYSFADFAVVCVPMFVFVTAYGMSAKFSEIEWSRKNIEDMTIRRYVSLIMPFWIIFIIAQILCNLLGMRTYTEIYGPGYGSGLYFIFDGFGLARCFGTPTLNPTWWYMSLATLLIFIMPLIWRLVDRMGIVAFFAAFMFFRMSRWTYTGSFNFITLAIFGAAVYKADIFGKLGRTMHKRPVLQIMLFVAGVIMLGAMAFLKSEGGYQDIVYCVLIFTIAFMQQQFFCRIKPLTILLRYFGKHSMNIFLTHTFIKTVFLHDFVYSFKYPILIWAMLMLLSLICSYMIEGIKKLIHFEEIQIKVLKKILR